MENKTKNSEILNKLPYAFEEINSSFLKIPVELYQRELRNAKVRRIVEDFNECVANEPKVSYRNGRYRVFDGQHTVAARIIRNHGAHLPIICKVYYDLTEEDEAHLFAMQTGTSSKPKSGETLKAELCAKNPRAVDLMTATEENGLNISLSNTHGYDKIACVKCAEQAYAKLGRDKYMEAISILRQSWKGTPKSFYADLVTGVCDFVNLYHGEYNRDRLIERLKAHTPEDILRAMRLDDSVKGTKKCVKQIYDIYNRGCKKKLQAKF